MSDFPNRLDNELTALNEAAQRAARTALSLNHSQAESLRMIAAFTERLVNDTGPPLRARH
ncbi:hypothetical protein [Paracoccus salipaludis]|uniref:Uncharacterized protein n=1 Tax=Paracoccus salipaludis TaxID=2032623 RepID=A0A2A2GHL3_9RHOB|nr:hypothetical protein [Paracoccus salipaludis]PAU96393.1 hypothetical protein CK240_14230 [Paracoccus salipaludis]